MQLRNLSKGGSLLSNWTSISDPSQRYSFTKWLQWSVGHLQCMNRSELEQGICKLGLRIDVYIIYGLRDCWRQRPLSPTSAASTNTTKRRPRVRVFARESGAPAAVNCGRNSPWTRVRLVRLHCHCRWILRCLRRSKTSPQQHKPPLPESAGFIRVNSDYTT